MTGIIRVPERHRASGSDSVRRNRRRAGRTVSWALLLGWLALAAHGRAELVVLRGGHVLKVTSYEVVGDAARITLPSGGRLELPLLRVERVVEDEIDREDGAAPHGVFPLRFAASQEVPETPFGQLIFDVARRHRMNPELVAAVIRAESAFDPTAVSPKGARGLMQLMPATAERFGVALDELFEPARNLEAGTGYLDWLTERFDGDLDRVLAAYNAGEGIVDRYDGVPPYRETRQYLRRIYSTLGLDDVGR
jgi:hypothetical protein